MIHKYHSWDIVWLLVFTSVYTHVGLLAALARGGGGGGGRYVGRAMVEAVLGGVAQSPDQSCSSVHPPADLLTTPHRRAAPHHYIHTYTVTTGQGSEQWWREILSTGFNLKLWMMNQHKNDLIFFRPRCVVNLLMQKFKSNIFAISFVIDLFMQILKWYDFINLKHWTYFFIYFR